jgi:signal transduction histidine kinase
MIPVATTLPATAPEPIALAARAHAIQNCLGVIVGLASTIEHHVEPAALPRVAQLLNASRSLSDLLKCDAAPPGLARGTVHVAALIRHVIDRLTTQAENGFVRLAIDCDGGTVVGDSRELAEAIYNVASNAVQASAPGSEVRIATRTTPDGDQEWTVEDAGCGIPATMMPLLGTPGVSSRSGGMGLGLPVALQVIRRHDGVMRVESAGGGGTTVRMWLPGRGAGGA